MLHLIRSKRALLLGALALASCRTSEERAPRVPEQVIAVPADTGILVPIKYAQGFSLRRSGEVTWVEVRKPWQGATADFRYRLVPLDSLGSPGIHSHGFRTPSGHRTLGFPARRVVTMTTTNLPHLERLGALGSLVGIAGGGYACNPAVRARLSGETLRELGEESALDVEAALDLRPDLVFAFAVANYSNPALKKMSEAGLPVVMEAAYMEETPLGRAEWIKFTAAFFGKAAAADSAFAEVESAYNALAALAKRAARRPTVVVNAPNGGLWWIPGGRTYVARLLADAGAEYLWAGDTTRGSLSLDLEAVLARAAAAEYWLNPGPWTSLADGKNRDPRHALFESFRSGRVWNNDLVRCGPGNDFFEKGSARPDWILADLIALFHPDLLPNHRFRWYRKLEAR